MKLKYNSPGSAIRLLCLPIMLIIISNWSYSQSCNQKEALVNGATFDNISATLTDDVGSIIPFCIGGITDVGNVVDGDLTNFASVDIIGVGCNGILSVSDADDTYPAGTFAGFEVSATGLLQGAVQAEVTIRTYLSGTLQEEFPAIAPMAGANSDLINENENAVLGFVTNQSFNEITIEYTLIAGVLFSAQIYYAVIEEFCPGPQLECGMTYYLTNPEFPTVIDGALTGIGGLVCGLCAITGVENVISEDITDYASINKAGGIAASGSIGVLDVLGTYPAGSIAGFVLENPDTNLQTGLFDTIAICTYLDGILQECQTTVEVFDLMAIEDFIAEEQGIYNAGIETTMPYDEIRITVGALVSTTDTIKVYSAFVDTRGSKDETLMCECSLDEPVVRVECSDNDTPEQLDDVFEYYITMTGSNTGAGYSISGDDVQTGLAYGVEQGPFGPFLISGGSLNLIVTDDLDDGCMAVTESEPLRCQICNQMAALVNGQEFDNITALVTDDVGSAIPPCIGDIADEGNVVDQDLSNNASVTITGTQCNGILSVSDSDDVYSVGTFTGFEVSSEGMLQGSVQSEVTIRTYLEGALQETYPAVTEMTGINSDFVTENDNVVLGFVTSQEFDEVTIEYASLFGTMYEAQVYCAGIVNAVLPLGLIDFKVEYFAGEVHLEWKTTNELNVDYFNIERRSEESESFETIVTVEALGHKSPTLEYRYTDDNANETGTYYYRLKIVDRVAGIEFSDVKAIDVFIEDLSKPVLYPNPTFKEATIDFYLSQNELVKMSVFDMNGQLIQENVFYKYFREGKHSERINIHYLEMGVYTLLIELGDRIVRKKLVVL